MAWNDVRELIVMTLSILSSFYSAHFSQSKLHLHDVVIFFIIINESSAQWCRCWFILFASQQCLPRHRTAAAATRTRSATLMRKLWNNRWFGNSVWHLLIKLWGLQPSSQCCRSSENVAFLRSFWLPLRAYVIMLELGWVHETVVVEAGSVC